MRERDYTIDQDAYGRHYLSHGKEWKDHKYIKKIGLGKLAQYFYTKEELQAYLKNVGERMKETGETVQEAGKEVAQKMKNGMALAKNAAEQPRYAITNGNNAARNVAVTVGKTVKDAAQKLSDGAAKSIVSVPSVKSLAAKPKNNNSEKASDRLSVKDVAKSIGEAISKAAEKIAAKVGVSRAKSFESASGTEKMQMLSQAVRDQQKASDADYAMIKELTNDYRDTSYYQAVASAKQKHGKSTGSNDESSNTDSDDSTDGSEHSGSAHGFTSRKRNITGEAKEGWNKLRDDEGNDPHPGATGINIHDDDAIMEYAAAAEAKIAELGGTETAAGRELYAKTVAELGVTYAAKLADSCSELDRMSEELEKARAETAAEVRELEKLSRKMERNPGSVSDEEIEWARQKLTSAYEKENSIENGIIRVTNEMDTYGGNMQKMFKVLQQVSPDANWEELVGIDPRFLSGR